MVEPCISVTPAKGCSQPGMLMDDEHKKFPTCAMCLVDMLKCRCSTGALPTSLRALLPDPEGEVRDFPGGLCCSSRHACKDGGGFESRRVLCHQGAPDLACPFDALD